MLKKLWLILISTLLLLNISSCGEKADEETTAETAEQTSEAPLVTETVTEEVTTAAETEPAEPIGKELSIAGSVYGREKASLSLHLEWRAQQSRDNENCALTVSVFLDCYAISASPKSGTLNIGGEVYEFTAPEIRNSENLSSSYELFTMTVNVISPYSTDVTVNLSASYDFFGTYGGAEVAAVSVSDSILLSEDGNYINPLTPELPPDAFTPD